MKSLIAMAVIFAAGLPAQAQDESNFRGRPKCGTQLIQVPCSHYQMVWVDGGCFGKGYYEYRQIHCFDYIEIPVYDFNYDYPGRRPDVPTPRVPPRRRW